LATTTNKGISEWKGDPITPEMLWEGGDQVFDGSVSAECPEAGEVAVHVTREGADDPAASLYMTPAQAYLHAERIRTAAWIAENLPSRDTP
jgi:hypothetical protein